MLVQMNGVTFLTDPVLSERCSAVQVHSHSHLSVVVTAHSSGGVKHTDEDSVPCLYELTFVHSVALITEVGAPSSLLFGFLPV